VTVNPMMHPSRTGLPTAPEAIDLPVDELAMRLLRVFSRDSELATRAWMENLDVWSSSATDDQAAFAASLRAIEAWDWLIHHGLVALRPGVRTVDGQSYVTQRGHDVAHEERGLARVRAEARIGLDLHRRLAPKIRPQFLLGEYELAAFAAMREVEIRARELAGYGDEVIGVDLMRRAFHPETGPLGDAGQVAGERQATSDFFAGAIGTFKNPSSHRQVDFDDPTTAAEIVFTADLLLRMLDAVEARLAA
jgi:uncharacterized protein (TIGR02391 family)